MIDRVIESAEVENKNHPIDNEKWDMVLSPKTNIFSLNLKEVWNYRDLLMLFVRRDFVAQYKQTILGPVWHFIQPLFTTIMFVLIFGKIANIPTDNIEPKILFYMSGITIWNYFSNCLNATSNTFVANASIFGKVYFPRLILPLSIVMSNIIKFGIQFLLMVVMIVGSRLAYKTPIYINFQWFFIPLLVLMMSALGLGLGIIISSLTTKYRDFAVLISFGVQLLMYATPIAYPLSFLKDKSYGFWVALNPLTSIVEAFRSVIFGHGTFSVSTLSYSLLFIVLTLLIGLVLFNKVEKSFMDTV